MNMSARFNVQVLYFILALMFCAHGTAAARSRPRGEPVETFSLKANVPGTKYNGRAIYAFETEGSDFVFSLFYANRPPTNFSIEPTTNYLTTLANPRGSNTAQTLYTYGRSNFPRENGYGYLNTKEVLRQRGTFKRDTWRCEISDARQLDCASSFGDNFFVCGPYGWVYLRAAAPKNGRDCHTVRFLAF